MKTIFLFALIFLTSCQQQKESWETAMFDHVCTEKQFDKTKKESDYCIKETDYFHSYCLNAAIMRNCDKRTETKK